MRMTGAQALLHVLRRAGINQVFGLASGKLSPFYCAMQQADDVNYVGVRHEAAAAFMATAVFAGTGVPAVCLGETGPGGLNLMSALGGARANNLAVVAITSSNPSHLLAPIRGAFSSTDNEAQFSTLVKWSATIRDVARVPELVRHALRTGLSGRPGPVHLDVPSDVLAAEYTFDQAELDAAPESYRCHAPSIPVQATLRRAAALLKDAQRPLLIAGGGALRGGAQSAFSALLDRLPAVGMTTQMGLGALSPAHTRSLGQGGFAAGPAAVRALRDADVVLAVGCRFSSFLWTDGPPRWSDLPERRLIQIDIDPEMLGLNVPLTLGIQGDALETISALLDYLPADTVQVSDWIASLIVERDGHRAALAALADSSVDPMHPAALAREVAKFIGEDDLVTFDGGHTSFWSNDFTPAHKPGTRFHEPGMAHLGFGLPWAIALGICFPARRSFCLTGDGAFGFTLQELDTARRTGTNVITIIHNNAAWGVIGFGQVKSGFELGTSLEGTDYVTISRGFGCHAERVERLDQVAPAVRRALNSGLPAVVDARVAFEPHPMLSVFGKSTAARST